MAPNFLSKFVKNSPSAHDRSRTASSPSPSPVSRQPSISVTPPTVSRPSTSTIPKTAVANNHTNHISIPSNGYDSSDSSINPNVTVVPPSPHTSDISMSDDQATPRSATYTDAAIQKKPSRRLHSLSVGSKPMPSPPGSDDDVLTPTPSARPTMSERSTTVRPLSHASSTGNLREQVQSEVSPARSATLIPLQPPSQLEEPIDLQRSVSAKSSRSQLRIKLSTDASPSAPQVKHDRSATAPPTVVSSPANRLPGDETASNSMSPIVESPTGISPNSLNTDFGPPKPALNASATLPALSSSTFLGLPDNSDAASLYSVNSTTKKRRPWRRGSVKEPVTPTVNGGGKSPKRKATGGGGLASAIAASGLAMANPGLTMHQISPTESGTRDGRSDSVTSSSAFSHRARGSVELTRTPPSRSRQPSLSYPVSDLSDRESFHSGLDSSGSSDDDDDDLDLDADDIPVTGFAVASNRRNLEFHEMFPNIPEGDYLIEDYGCALQREILIQGRIYISENHVCFHANIFGWITDLSIPMYEVTALDKRMTAFVIPNAIQVTTRNAKYTFTSFLSRDTTFDVMYNVWRLARPEDTISQVSPRGSLDTGAEVVDGTAKVVTNGMAVVANGKPKVGKVNKVTQCACGRAGQHFNDVAMESILPGTPEKIYNLMFTSGFIKDFMRDDQKLMDIQISDWIPLLDSPKLLARNMSYIKPLYGSIGPKQTKCEIRDELVYCDFNEYVVMMTTTRTPDVPSGGVFSVKTRTCITWASSVSTKVLVTSQVEWTGRSFIKGIIEKSAIDGQKTYHADLEKGMREYIHKHQSEFIPEGVDVAEVEETEAQAVEAPRTPTLTTALLSEEQVRKEREHERNQRSLQWAYDTFEGACKVAKQSTEGALELIRDAWDQSTSSTILYFVIALLVISNIWTLTMVGKREEVGRRKELRKMEEREKWVQGVVTALWDELTANRAAGGGALLPPLVRSTSGTNRQDEVAEINNALDLVEDRIQGLRESIKDLD